MTSSWKEDQLSEGVEREDEVGRDDYVVQRAGSLQDEWLEKEVNYKVE